MLSTLKQSPVMLNNSIIKCEPIDAQSNVHYKKKDDSPSLANIRNRIKSIVELLKKPGALTPVHLLAAGFKYTGDGDKARCDYCGLELSNWTLDMNPFDIHLKQKSDCPFVRSMIPSSFSNIPSSSTTVIRNTLISDIQENPSKRQKLEKTNSDDSSTTFVEIDMLLQVRRRTFSHWPHRTTPSSAQMIEAGFFSCNVSDRVICIYCNLICQQWTPHTDDPCEVHKTLSPKCPYVKAKLIRPSASSIIIVNESSTTVAAANQLPTSNNLDPLRSNQIVSTAACNPAYAELPKRHASFTTWPHEDLPPVDDLVRAGFFYTGTKTIVTCFYCNGSLQNWGPNDNPMIEHARWFSHCAYAKQLCGDDMYRKIQESKRAQQERARAIELRDKTGSGVMSNTNVTTNSRQLLIPDESTLSRLVAAKLDLPISQRLLDQNFKLSIIKRCWEDQLRLKQNDFVSECDLFIACLILQKQIEYIDGKKENIVIPSITMKRIRERNEGRMREETTNLARSTVNTNDVETTTSQSLKNESTSSQSSVESISKLATAGTQVETKTTKQTPPATQDQEQSNNATPSNPCVVCLTEEKTLACMPCGHMATCVSCSNVLRACPRCGRAIIAFLKIYI